ncbi:MAG: flagellar hook basal-body protein [Deferribacteraceae bacterium]|jgi:flagellar basal-body rod protein FlgG|nr:flagellar hook basal-body protein [Deferribacteraceae bacterium]
MLAGLHTAASALSAGVKVAAVNAHNVANVNTPGYKSSYAALSEMATGGVKVSSILRNSSQGSIRSTGQPYDLAIIGKGNFELNDGLGPLYTRNGVFSRDYAGNITDPLGRVLFRDTPYDVSIGEDGTIYNQNNPIGRIQLYDGTGAPIAQTAQHIVSGWLEMSNVSILNEIVDQILYQRAFEANARSVRTMNENLGTIINMVR